MIQTKARDMTEAQITHTFCSFCNYRVLLASQDYWGCRLEGTRKEKLCLYKQAVRKEDAEK